ncbi:MAG: class I adenylate cyclase [Pseudomonadota bacterium]
MVRSRTPLFPEDAYEEGIDIHYLQTSKQRFLSFNSIRLQRMRSVIRKRQSEVIEVLPLLFHLNHPLLPGWCGPQVPHGISHYEPSETELNHIKRLVKSLRLEPETEDRKQIAALYLMGSTGSIAQSESSDLDIWIVHEADLPEDSIVLLQEKVDKIEKWANDNAANVHCFLMSPNYFRLGGGQISHDENCGTAQHFLLLDEFYRTGLLLAGCFPLWWVISPEKEVEYDEYAEELFTKRFSPIKDAIDFGAIKGIPANEFLGAALWQLHKAISDPYKSVIKTLLMEHYAAAYPDVLPSSQDLKLQVINLATDLETLDPYLLVFQQIENYLQTKGKLEQLELARRCFYLKIDEKLSSHRYEKARHWRRSVMQNLVKQWEWSSQDIEHLDKRNQWKAMQVIAERRKLMGTLNHSYHFLTKFASKNDASAHISYDDLMLLGRKLFASFERKPGKIERINPGITSSLVEKQLSFQCELSGHEKLAWYLYGFDDESKQKVLFKKSLSLVELLAWASVNGLYDKGTEVQVIPKDSEMIVGQVIHLLNFIHQSCGRLPFADSIEAFRQAAQANRCIFIINLGIDPIRQWLQEGFNLVSDQSDVLAYSAMQANLVQQVDLITINTWSEVSVNHYAGEDSLLQAMCSALNLMGVEFKQEPFYDVWCYYSNHSEAITRRCKELINDVLWSFFEPSYQGVGRYLLSLGKDFALLDSVDGHTGFTRYKNMPEVWEAVSLPLNEYCPLVIDSHADVDDLFRDITNVNKKNVVQIFYRIVAEKVFVIILDEKGAAYFAEHYSLYPMELIKHYLQFVERSAFRRRAESAIAVIRAIEIIEVTWRAKSHAYSMSWHHDIVANCELPGNFVQVIGTWTSHAEIEYTFFCDNHEFHPLEFGDDLYRVVAEQIIKKRQSTDEFYPVYISDLDLKSPLDSAQWSTSILLRYKQQVETSINAALEQAVQDKTSD